MASWTERARAILLAVTLWSQAGPAPAQHALFEPYQESAGLTSMAVECLAQTPDGALWIGTENGLFRFDGFRVRREPLPEGIDNDVNEVLSDRAGRLWVATRSGLFLRREVGGVPRWLAVVRTDGHPLDVDGLQRMDIDARGTLFAMDRHNQMWTVAAPRTEAEAPPRQLVASQVALPPHEPFRGSIDADSGPVRTIGDALWLACGSGLCRWQSGRLRAWGPADGLPAAAWGTLLRARDGSLWARSADRLARLAPGGERFETQAAPAAKLWPAYIPLAEDREGGILTGTDDGVARWDGRAWTRWTPRDGLPETAVRALLVDAHGALWLGTAGRGLHRWIGYGVVEHWTTAEGLPSPVVWEFARDGAGRLCLSTSRGVACLDEATRRFRPVDLPAVTPGRVFGLGHDADGDLWWVEDGHVLTLRPGEAQAHRILDDASLLSVVSGPDSLYVTGMHGVRRLVASRVGARFEPLPPGIPDPLTFGEVIGDGHESWFLADHGAYRLVDGRWAPLVDAHGAPVQMGGSAAFAGPTELWTADPRGIAVYAVHDGVARLSRRFDASFIDHAAIEFLRVDADRRVWLGTDHGLFIYEAGRWSHLDRDAGLLWNDVDGGAFFLDRDGAAWIGTSAGATRLLPGGRPSAPPTLRVGEIRFGDRVLSQPPSEPVPWSDRRVRVILETPDIDHGRETRLEYRLRDDAPWQPFEDSVVRLESLDADAYRLQVRAAGRLPADPVGPPLEVAFTIAPPWWSAWPARCAYAVALAAAWGLSILFLRRRACAARRGLEKAISQRTRELETSREAVRMLSEHNARALEEERMRVSRELHDDMGQQLAALRMEASVLRQGARAGQPPEDGAFGMLMERVDGIVASMRGIVSQLRPPVLDGGLTAALEWLSGEFARYAGVTCRLEIDAGVRGLPPDAATMVFRIAQESLNNAHRHARATQVMLHLRQDGEDCELSIRDDGIGFDLRRRRPGGYGLAGMEERARVLGGTLSIDSLPGEGTTVRLRMRTFEAARELKLVAQGR